MSELIVAVVTPFLDNKIDINSYINLLNTITRDSDGILLLGSTAESRLLTLEEKIKLVDIAFKEYPKKIIIGLEGNSVGEIISLSKHFEKYDCFAYLISPIPYIKQTQNGIINYYMELADKLDKPIILYEISKRCGSSISINSLNILKSHYNVIGIKDASGDEKYSMDLASIASCNFKIYGGDDTRIPTSLLYNASGIISVLGNKYPNLVKNIINEFPKTDLFIKNKELIDLVFVESSPLPIKYMLGNMESKKELGVLKQSSKDKICYLLEKYEDNKSL